VILVTDGWLANTGDAASYMATSQSLRQALPGARVAIASHHRSLVGNLYPDLDLAPPIDPLAGVSWPWTTAADLAERETIERLVERADLILAAGGGYLLERYQPDGRIRIYEELLERGKRMVFYSQSVGRFRDPELGKRLKAVLAAAEMVLVRDEPSLAIVQDQRASDDVHLTADEAFLFPAQRRLSRPRSLLVTVSLHPWDRSGGDDEIGDDPAHLLTIAAALTRLLESGAVDRITLASTAQGFGGSEWALEDDSVASRTVLAAIPAHRRNQVEVRGEYLRPDTYVELAARHVAVISMRMHGAILAAAGGTPVLMANASDKARALSERTDGGMAGIETSADLARLDELVRPLLDDPRQALVRQNEAVEQMRTLARTNATLVAGRLQ
jgi:polysaccharide pyruvyl transferase WcaK-like protein